MGARGAQRFGNHFQRIRVIIDGQHGLSGAQPPEAILEVLDELAGATTATATGP